MGTVTQSTGESGGPLLRNAPARGSPPVCDRRLGDRFGDSPLLPSTLTLPPRDLFQVDAATFSKPEVRMLASPLPLLAARTGLHAVDYLVVTVYMAVILYVGWRCSQTQETSEQFFVGDRNLPWWATGLSLIATMMSTLTYLGVPGEIFGQGIAMLLQFTSLPFALLIIGWVWVPFYMKLRLTSAYEYLDLRFGTPTRLLAVVLFLYMRFVWLGLVIYSSGRAIAEMTVDTAPAAIGQLSGGLIDWTGHPERWQLTILLMTGLLATAYTTLGGIRAVIWTDAIQFVVLFLGAVLTLLVVFAKTGTGPLAWYEEAVNLPQKLPPLASTDFTVRNTILVVFINGLLWHVCTHACDQVALQRYFCNESAREARRTCMVNYICDALMSVLLALVGLALLAYYQRNLPELTPELADSMQWMLEGGENRAGSNLFADRVFPYFIAHGLPIGLAGLTLAGVFAVAQSSVDSGINSTSTVIMVDLIRRHRRQPLSSADELRWTQWLTVLIGILVTGIAVMATRFGRVSSIMELQLQSFNAVLGPLGAVFMAGFLLPRVSQAAVLTGGFCGVMLGLTLGLWPLLDQQLMVIRESTTSLLGPPVSPFWIIPLSWLTTVAVTVVSSLLTRPPRPAQIQGLTIWTVETVRHPVA